MNDEVKKEHKDQKPELTIEDAVKVRIRLAVQDEVVRLEQLVAKAELAGNTAAQCQAIESIAAVKARAEVYCLQVEMAAKTAAAASMFSGMSRAVKDDGAPAVPGRGLESLIHKAKGGGGGDGDPPKDDQSDNE